MLILYFSGTGNTEHVAQLFSKKTGAKCLSIETDTDITAELKSHDTLAFCYPIYGSRVPRIMREFVVRHIPDIAHKKLIILVTQTLFSGDGARVFTDMFWEDTVNVIYAEHIHMPNNICNTPLLWPTSQRKIEKYKRKAEMKIAQICSDIEKGVVKRRGFSRISQWLGNIQGRAWQGDSKDNNIQASLEQKAKDSVKIHNHCSICGLCIKICPAKNLATKGEAIEQLNNCTVCYRCVNRCPQKAITVLFHKIPKWQYKGLGS